MATWITDVLDILPAYAPESAVARPRTDLVRELVEAATSRRDKGAWSSAVRCIAKVQRRRCGARLLVDRPEAGRIAWCCAACGEGGVITGFEGTELDLSPYWPSKKKLRFWGFDDEGRAVLRSATTHIPSLRAVISRARPAPDVPGLLVVEATVEELDAMYTLVEQLTEATRSRRRRDLFTGMRADLCGAIDGF
jgi:hypothetical protein